MTSLINLNSKALKKGDGDPSTPARGQILVYSMRFCPWAERVILYLSYKHISAEVINIHLAEKPEWYFKKHPEGKVPSLEVDDEVTIESSLIPEYLDDKFPERRILPLDPFAKFQQKLLVEQLSVLSSTFYGLVGLIKDPSANAEEKLTAVKTAFSKAEGLLKGKFYGGDQVGYADLLLYPFFERHYWIAAMKKSPLDGEDFPGKEYPKLSKYFAAISTIPEIKTTLQPLEAVTAFFASYTTGKADYDAGL